MAMHLNRILLNLEHLNKGTTANKVLPKAGRNGFDWTFVQGSTFVLRLNFCAKNPPPSAIPKPLWGIL